MEFVQDGKYVGNRSWEENSGIAEEHESVTVAWTRQALMNSTHVA